MEPSKLKKLLRT